MIGGYVVRKSDSVVSNIQNMEILGLGRVMPVRSCGRDVIIENQSSRGLQEDFHVTATETQQSAFTQQGVSFQKLLSDVTPPLSLILYRKDCHDTISPDNAYASY
jgi:hypothetical protein